MITELGLMVLMVPCGIIDLRKKELPLGYIGMFSLIGTIYSAFTHRISMMQMLLGAVIGMIFLIISLASKNRFGFGDGLILGAIGLWAGGEILLGIMMRAFLMVVIVEGILVIIGKKTMKTEVPFGPFLAASCLFQWLFRSL